MPIADVFAIVRSRAQNFPADSRVLRAGMRSRIDALFRMGGTACGVDGSRTRTHPVRSGAASATFAAGYEVGAIKRWGRWLSSTLQQYWRRGQLIMSTIGRGMIPLAAHPFRGRNHGRAGGKRRKWKGKNRPKDRLCDISKEQAKLLLRRNMGGEQRDGFAPVGVVANDMEAVHLRETQSDLEIIFDGEGANSKHRYGSGATQPWVTRAIRETQGGPWNA